LFRRMRGREVLTFLGRLRARGSAERAYALADRLALDLDRGVAQMSTGMRQKLALAATLAAETPLVILDEPTANLDPTVRGDVLALVDEARQAGRAVLFSSHVLDEVEAVCDRVGILRQGRLVHQLRTSELRRQHRIRARLTGPLPLPPPTIASQLAIRRTGDEIEIETPGELSPLLGWLATAPLAEVRIEPVGLRAVYDRFHAPPTHQAPEDRT
jgi:ABC-2 type transport system ATP-binding protein